MENVLQKDFEAQSKQKKIQKRQAVTITTTAVTPPASAGPSPKELFLNATFGTFDVTMIHDSIKALLSSAEDIKVLAIMGHLINPILRGGAGAGGGGG